MSGRSADTETIWSLHQYDEVLTDEPWDLALVEVDGLAAGYEREETAEELVEKAPAFPRQFQDSRRMLMKMAVISGHQSGYKECPGGFKINQKPGQKFYLEDSKKVLLERGGPLPKIDFVDEIREQERNAVSEKTIELLKAHGISIGEEESPAELTRVPGVQPVREDATVLLSLAAEIGATPEKMHLPRYIRTLKPDAMNKLLAQVKLSHAQLEWAEQEKQGFPDLCKNLVEAAEVWNYYVHAMAPRNVGGMRHNNRWAEAFRQPGSEVQPHLAGIRKTFKDQSGVRASDEWKKLAEEGKIPNKITQCKITGESLIQRKTRDGLESWWIGPNIRGMGLRGAHMIVELAALNVMPQEVLQQLYKKEFVGVKSQNPPELVSQLMNDADAWAILAAHTNHPRFSKFAKLMLAWRNSIYLKLKEADVREAERIGAKIAYELQQAYPAEFAAACEKAKEG